MTQEVADESTRKTQVTAQTVNEEVQTKIESIEDTRSINDVANITDEDNAETEAILISEVDNQESMKEEPIGKESEDSILTEEDSDNKENEESDETELAQKESDDSVLSQDESDDRVLSQDESDDTEFSTEKSDDSELSVEERGHDESEIPVTNTESVEDTHSINDETKITDEDSAETEAILITKIYNQEPMSEELVGKESEDNALTVEDSYDKKSEESDDSEESGDKENDTFLENISRHLSALSHEEKERKSEITENPLQDLLPFSSKFITQQVYFKEDDLPKSLFVPKNENNLIKHDFSDDFLSFDPEIQTDMKADMKDDESILAKALPEHEITTIKDKEQAEPTIPLAQSIDQDEADLFESTNSEVMQLTEDMLLPQQNIKTDNKTIELELDLTPQSSVKNKKTNNSKLELLWDSSDNQEKQKESNQTTEKNDTLSFFPENKD